MIFRKDYKLLITLLLRTILIRVINGSFFIFLYSFKEICEEAYMILREDRTCLATYLYMRNSPHLNASFLFFYSFKEICEEAYMILREDRKRLVTLFLMMVNTGIPELPNVAAIQKHLHKTLQPEKSDAEARKLFREQIKIAMKKSFMVALHGQFHNIKH